MMKLKSGRRPFYKDVKLVDCRSGSSLPHLAAQAKFAAMNMKTEDVNPRRPVQVRRSRWALGDVTEVLDHNSWRLGKITEVLKNDYFVIRLVGCIQPREFHISCLRIPHDRKQLTVGGRINELNKPTRFADCSSHHSKFVMEQDHQAYEEVDHYAKRKAANICASTGARAVKRKLEASRIPPNGLVRRTGKEQKVSTHEFRQLTKNELPPKVSARNAIDEDDHFHRPLSSRYNDLPEKPLRTREEDECSVASCSANYTSGTKRPSSNTDTASSPPKKNKNAMVRCMKGLLDRLDSGSSKDVDTATQIQEIIETKRKEQQAADFKEIDLCLALAKECGATEETDEFFVASQLFASCKFQRHVFLGLSSNAGRMAWLKKHCKGWTF
ncbi:Plant Tudor-like RNA-binding protein [Zea mays]|uniref:Plant Tudor-like RNA-binding protein n=1 Tax=Zea mays TaxID=4577 RepID=B4FJG2_MAIZE|nr:unknown [Zea mays]ONM27681.1 Plant Tudor-like RNA-binding protein [Zea mays]ONM27684.1 Plant Tudor-like RNA-binding protein [Zea mays]ONM27685.1 Plant Tudor-like RNA-binding protein [Zea mays]